MSVEIDTPGFFQYGHPQLANGHVRFGFESPTEIARFIDFCFANPDHVFRGDGMDFPCSLLVERYLKPGRYTMLTAGDLDEALRTYGWLRDDGDGERLHTTRPT